MVAGLCVSLARCWHGGAAVPTTWWTWAMGLISAAVTDGLRLGLEVVEVETKRGVEVPADALIRAGWWRGRWREET